jgi:hypothetical protein
MDLAPTILSTGWAAGVNAYLTVAVLGLAGRAGVGEVPEPLTSDGVIAAALIMSAVEFVVDKVPYVDNLWDLISTAVRPAVASAIGALFAVETDVRGVDEALAAAGSGTTALASHAVKASIRLAVNSSPEPLSNIAISLAEDATVAGLTWFALEEPVIAAVIAVTLLVLGAVLVALLVSRIRGAVGALGARWSRGPP